MGWLEDRAQRGYKVYREHTASVKEDMKNTNQGVQIDDQNDITGEYTFSHKGDETGWLHWESGETPAGDSPPVGVGNRDIFPSDYMKKSDIPVLEARKFGTWAQVVPSAGRPEGVFPLTTKDGDVDSRFQGQKIINSGYENDEGKVKTATGNNMPYGFPGLTVQTTDSEKHEHLFFPSGGLLVVDHAKGALSTKVLETESEGWLDTARPASLDSLLRIGRDENNADVLALNASKSGVDTTGYAPILFVADGINTLAYLSSDRGGPICSGDQSADIHKIGVNDKGESITPAHIATNAYFYMDKNHDGVLAFENTAFPTVTEPANPDYLAPVHCAFDSAQLKWRWYVGIDSGESTIIARVRWDYDMDSDLSEAEICTIDQNHVITATGTLVWISFSDSSTVKFETAGDDTLFEIKRIASNVNRGGIVRDLYRVSKCRYDNSYMITHLKTINKQSGILVGNLLSEDLTAPQKVWENSSAATINVTIAGQVKAIKMPVRIPAQWNSASVDNWQYVEVSNFAVSLPFYFRPIRPVMDDIDNKIYRSAEETGGSPIAYYRMA